MAGGEMIPKAAGMAKGAGGAAKGAGAAKDAKDASDAAQTAKGAKDAQGAVEAGKSAGPGGEGGKGFGGVAASDAPAEAGAEVSGPSASGSGEKGPGGDGPGSALSPAGGKDAASGADSGGGAGPGGGSDSAGGKGLSDKGSSGSQGEGGKGSGGSSSQGGSGFGGVAPSKSGKSGGDDGKVMQKGDAGKSMAAGAAAAPGAAVGSQLMAIAALMNWMKSMFFAAAAMAGNLLSTIAAAAVAATQAVGGALMTAGAAVAGFVGGGISAVTGAIATGAAVLAAGAVAVTGAVQVSSNNEMDVAQRDGNLAVCGPAREGTIRSIHDSEDGTDLDTSAKTDENAEKVYAIFAGMGMPDENIAGILGNWTAESGVDPTGVETIFDEPYTIGPRKQAAQDAGWDIEQVDAGYAAQFPAIDKMGIGLGQWTNERNTMLMDYSEKIGGDWHALETQLGFMVSDDDPTRVSYIKEMINNPAGSPEAATHDFMSKWEGISDGSTGTRVSAANSYYSKMGQWEADEDLANSILDQSGGSVGDANQKAVSNAQNGCLTEAEMAQNADNSSLALSMTSYAYATTKEGEGNNGTQLYQDLHDAIFPGDPWYMSCDRSVAVAVRWSGSDDNYPAGPVSAQLDYLASSDKWDEVTDWGGDPKNLEPGDILLRYDSSVSHTVMYVGEEAVQQVHGDKADPGSNVASGSLNTRSPGVGTWYTGSTGLDTYKVYRNVKTETNSKYVDLMPDSGVDNDNQGNKGPKGDGSYIAPVSAPISSGYGMRDHPVSGGQKMHNGIDFGVACGTPIKAAADGKIVRETTSGASGNRLDIDHGNGVTTGYFHQSKFKAHKGDTVRQGDVIGYVGTTGSSTGCHLHLAAMDSSGSYFNPMDIFTDL